MAAAAVGTAGGSQPFSIQSPALSLNWCVALLGIFPSRN
jgi:microcystin-dependent protein